MNRLIDLFEFIRQGQQHEGQLSLQDLPRVADLVLGQDQPSQFSLRGFEHTDSSGSRQLRLELKLSGVYALKCERCLQPVDETVDIARQFWVVKDESMADKLDLEVEDVDVIAGDRQFNWKELIEDELIMALPMVARHADCQLPSQGAQLEPEAEKPFAGLKALLSASRAGRETKQ